MKSPRVVVAVALLPFVLAAAEPAAPADAPRPATAAPKPADLTPGGVWKKGDMARPRPPVVDPGAAPALAQTPKPPSDAVVLFDGTDLSKWEQGGKGEQKGQKVPPQWKVENGHAEIAAGTGGINTKERFAGDLQLHIEWAAPAEAKGKGQGRGNSGVYVFGHGEVQVLDSFDNDTYPDGQAASLYNKHPPLVNASRRPGEWQTYDIFLQVARFDEKNQLVAPARLTVLHNGVLVQDAVETGGRAREGTLSLQDHGNPVRYRNIWVRPLKPRPTE